MDEFREKNPDWGKGIYATVSINKQMFVCHLLLSIIFQEANFSFVLTLLIMYLQYFLGGFLVHQEAWWEDPKFKASVEEASGKKPLTALEAAAEVEVVKDERTLEIEKIAKEWGKRQFFEKSMAGTIDGDMTEEAFIESVWDRAMFEGDVKYRQLKGEDLDEEAELLDFKAKQERKQQAMLKKAKEELREILEEDELGGEDLDAKLEGKDPDEKE